MDALTQTVMQRVSGDDLSRISKMIGANEQTTSAALSTAVPLLVAALAKNAAKPEGASSLQQALVKDHDGSILNDVAGFLGNPSAANGIGILGHILGAKQSTVQQGLAKSTGMDAGQIGQLLQIAAPLLMGALGQHQQQQGFDISALASFLGGQQQAAQQSNPNLTSMLGGGSTLGGILGLLGKLFGGQRQ